MRTKSYLSLLTGLLFSALVLSACSGSGNANNPGTAKDEATEAPATESTDEPFRSTQGTDQVEQVERDRRLPFKDEED